MCCSDMSKKGMSKMERDFQAEDDLRTMERAHELTSDKGRHSRAKRLAARKMASMRKLLGGRQKGRR